MQKDGNVRGVTLFFKVRRHTRFLILGDYDTAWIFTNCREKLTVGVKEIKISLKRVRKFTLAILP